MKINLNASEVDGKTNSIKGRRILPQEINYL